MLLLLAVYVELAGDVDVDVAGSLVVWEGVVELLLPMSLWYIRVLGWYVPSSLLTNILCPLL